MRLAFVCCVLLFGSTPAFGQGENPHLGRTNPSPPDLEPATAPPSDSGEPPSSQDITPAPETSPETGATVQPPAGRVGNHLARRTFAQVKGAPAPADAAHLAAAAEKPSALLWVPRILFMPVRGAFHLINIPVRSSLQFYEKYNVGERVQRFFFNDERTIGLYPTALFATGFGLNIGARFIHRDVLGRRIRLKMQAGFGGRFRQIYGVSLNLNSVLPKSWELGIQSTYQRRHADRFFGFGSNDISMGPVMAADPYETTADTRFRQELVTTWVSAKYSPRSRFSVAAIFGHTLRRFSDTRVFGVEQSIASVFDTTLISGFDQGIHHLTGDFSAQYDSRRGHSQWEPDAIPSRGVLLSAFGSLNQGVGRSDYTFARLGGQAQGFVYVAPGPRVLAVRFTTESAVAVDGSVPFAAIPRLGGRRLLRGYEQDRFRDKIAAVGVVEYSFDAGRALRIALFGDFGRTFPEVAELSLDDLRIGYGAEIQMVAGEQFRGRISMSSSIDGGLFFVFATASAFDTDERYARK